MDWKKYGQIVTELSRDLDSLKESLEVVVSRPYVDKSNLDDLDVNISRRINYINKFKVGLSDNCQFYCGLDELSKEYSSFRNELNSYKFEEA